MDGQDRLDLWRNPVLDVSGVDVQRLVTLGEHRLRAREHSGVIAGIPTPSGKGLSRTGLPLLMASAARPLADARDDPGGASFIRVSASDFANPALG
jgi:hypothetical protein